MAMIQDDRDLIAVMVSIMRAKRASARVAELAANIVAADARLNTRIGDAKAQGVLGNRIFDLLDFGDALLSECKTLERQLT